MVLVIDVLLSLFLNMNCSTLVLIGKVDNYNIQMQA
jgi:hypothetical protein